MFNLFSKSGVHIGVDIGAFGIKIAKIKKTDSVSIDCLDMEVLSTQDTLNSALITSKLKKLASRNGIKGKVNVAVNVADTIVRDIKVPVVPENELLQVVSWEAKKMVDISPETHNIDYIIHNMAEVEAGGKYKGMFVAARKDFLASRVKAIEDAGLEVSMLGLEADGYRAVMSINPQIEERIPTAIVDIGFSSTTIAIFHLGKLLFTRELNISIQKMITNIAEYQNITFNDAMEKLLNISLNSTEDYDNTKAVVINDFEAVASELNRSFNFFTSVAQKGMVDRVFVTGGLACIKGINGFMLEKLGIITKSFNPLLGVKFSGKLKGIEDQYSVALGMALIK
jgi:type IV pilus assembly protein PilM